MRIRVELQALDSQGLAEVLDCVVRVAAVHQVDDAECAFAYDDECIAAQRVHCVNASCDFQSTGLSNRVTEHDDTMEDFMGCCIGTKLIFWSLMGCLFLNLDCGTNQTTPRVTTSAFRMPQASLPSSPITFSFFGSMTCLWRLSCARKFTCGRAAIILLLLQMFGPVSTSAF